MIVCSQMMNCPEASVCAHSKPHDNETCANRGMGLWNGTHPCTDICESCELPDDLVTNGHQWGADPCIACICKPVEEMQRKISNAALEIIGTHYGRATFD